MTVTSIRLKPEIEKALREAAEKRNRSRNWLINQAVQEYLEKEIREELRWQDTLHALDSVSNGRVVEGDSVHSWIENWGAGNPSKKPE